MAHWGETCGSIQAPRVSTSHNLLSDQKSQRFPEKEVHLLTEQSIGFVVPDKVVGEIVKMSHIVSKMNCSLGVEMGPVVGGHTAHLHRPGGKMGSTPSPQ